MDKPHYLISHSKNISTIFNITFPCPNRNLPLKIIVALIRIIRNKDLIKDNNSGLNKDNKDINKDNKNKSINKAKDHKIWMNMMNNGWISLIIIIIAKE